MPGEYSAKVLDHYRHPRNFGKLDQPTHTAEELNPLCGDEIKVYLLVKNDRIEDIKYETRGCALSIASASLVSEEIRNFLPKADQPGVGNLEIRNWNLKNMEQLLGVKVNKARESCITLALNTIKKAVKN